MMRSSHRRNHVNGGLTHDGAPGFRREGPSQERNCPDQPSLNGGAQAVEMTMVTFTMNQWAILGLVLVLGWLLGLMSRSGGRRWRRAYQQEHEAHRVYRAETEARIAAANERIAELERHAPAIGVGTGSAIGAAARGRRDDLTQIRGIDRDTELRLNESGFSSFRDLARLNRSDEAALEGKLGLAPGRIERENWRDQAALIARGRVEKHHGAFG